MLGRYLVVLFSMLTSIARAQTNVTIDWFNAATTRSNVYGKGVWNLRLQDANTGSADGYVRLPTHGTWMVTATAVTDGGRQYKDEVAILSIAGGVVATFTNWPKGGVYYSNTVVVTGDGIPFRFDFYSPVATNWAHLWILAGQAQLVSTTAGGASGPTDSLTSEFKGFQASRNTAVSDAQARIDKRYKLQLETLLQRSKTAGSLDGTLFVQNALNVLESRQPEASHQAANSNDRFVQECERLKGARNDAVIAEVLRIDTQYAKRLESLVQRSTRTGKLDIATQINAELVGVRRGLGTATKPAAMSVNTNPTRSTPSRRTTDTVGSRRDLQELLTNSVCYWIEGGSPTNAPKGSFRVAPDGALFEIKNHLYVRKCEVLNSRYMKLQTRWTQVCVFDFDNETGLAKQVNKHGNYMFQPVPVYIRIEPEPVP